MLLPHGVAAGPAATPTCSEPIHRRSAVVLHVTRQKAGIGSSGSRSLESGGHGLTLPSPNRGRAKAGDPAASPKHESKPPKARNPKKSAPPIDGSAGLEGLDDLLADEDAVRQLRSTLLSSLSAQHEQSMLAEQRTSTSATAEAAPPAASATAPTDRRTLAKPSKNSSNTSTTDTSTSGDGSAEATPLVVLKKDKARLFASGNPVVYGGAVDCVIGRPPPGIGEPVMVADASRRPLGWGVYNPHSMFRVRLLQLQSEVDADPRVAFNMPALLQLRVRQAAELRRALGLPSADTNVYRLINSEGDRLSGLVADVLGRTVVVQAVAGWVQRYRQDVEAAIRAATGLRRIIWRPLWKILQEEGLQPPAEEAVEEEEAEEGPAPEATAGLASEGAEAEEAGKGPRVEARAASTLSGTGTDAVERSGNAAAAAAAAATPTAARAAVRGVSEEGAEEEKEEWETAEVVEVREAGLRLLASPQGQKTGFYADQRDSRAFLAALVRGQVAAGSPPSVLDLCCYSGGFALAAAAGGAARVIGVDSSEPAVKLATDNAQLNGLSTTASFLRADISEFMKAAVAQGQEYDIVVLDPPKLAPDRGSLARARIKYLRLNTLAMRLVRPGGLFMTCSCSGAMTQSGEFVDIVVEAAQKVGRQTTILREAGAATDHVRNPAYREGEYLTNVTLRLL